MQKVKTIGVVTITSGVVELSDSQAGKRMGMIKPEGKKGQYDVVKPIQFKAGEVFGIDVVTKTIQPLVEVVKSSNTKAAKSAED